jgi:hypothetical protein
MTTGDVILLVADPSFAVWRPTLLALPFLVHGERCS